MYYLMESNFMISDKEIKEYGMEIKNNEIHTSEPYELFSYGKIKKKSENVFDLIEVGDLVRFSSEFMIGFVEEINLINYGLKALNFGINKEYKPSAIYKPNKNGDYIKVWERVNENE